MFPYSHHGHYSHGNLFGAFIDFFEVWWRWGGVILQQTPLFGFSVIHTDSKLNISVF